MTGCKPTSRRPRIATWCCIALLVCGVAASTVAADTLPSTDLATLQAAFRRPDHIPFPDADPFTPEVALLGRTLFFDARISGSGSIACASCHNPSFGWEDGLPVGHGDGLRNLDRHSPTILNVAWGQHFFWDGRAPSLEAQSLGPLGEPREMNQPLARLPALVAAIPGYPPLFERAFPGQGVTLTTITKALATFERTIASARTPFDAWVDGDAAAIPDAAKRGFVLFTGKARCVACHTGWAFTDNRFHDIGLPSADPGRAAIAPSETEAMHAFKTPTLRDVARRAPFMHDGSLADLSAVVAHYIQGGTDRPSRSPLMTGLDLSAADVDDLVAFLESLSAPARSFPVPTLPQ